MGFFQKLFGMGGNAKPPLPEKTELQLKDVKIVAEQEAQKKLAPFLANAKTKIGGILSELEQIKKIAEEFSRKPIKTENPQHEKIAKQMKENYFLRIPKILDEIKKPGTLDFESVREFHVRLQKSVMQITKITSDNRYLIFFYKEEFERLGGPIKALAEAMDELGNEIGRNSEVHSTGKKINDALEEISRWEGQLLENTAAARRIGQELEDREKNFDANAYGNAEGACKRAENGISRNGMQISKIKGEIAGILLPLERLLRKYEKNAPDKRNAKIAKNYYENHLGALMAEDGKVSGLHAICDEIDKMLSENTLSEDERDRKKHQEIFQRIRQGEVLENRQKLLQLQEEAELLNADLIAKRKVLSEIGKKSADIDARKAERRKLENERSEMLEKIDSQRLQLCESMGALSGKQVVIVPRESG
ncbi:MAG: hypothetical protein V1835_01835 [Candidatus Micrarchaeota archaeon]